MGIGLIVFWVFGVITKDVSITNLLFCVFMAHAPDADMLLYMVPPIRRTLSLPSHRVIGHHPVLIIPFFVILGMWVTTMFPIEKWVLQGIILLVTHFIHDMTNRSGLHLLSPFDWTRWRLSSRGIHVVTEEELDEEFGDGTKYGQGGVSEFENRTEPLSITGVALVLTGITGTLFSFLIFQHH